MAAAAWHGMQQPEPERATAEHGGHREDHRQVVAAAGCDSFQAADGVATVKVELSGKPDCSTSTSRPSWLRQWAGIEASLLNTNENDAAD